MEKELHDLIENGYESNFLDFKTKMYPSKGKPDLLKDILAMANSNYLGKKYIIMGIQDDGVGGKKTCGINPEEKVDSSNYQQFILNNIEPDLNFDLYYINYLGKELAIIEIGSSSDKPYIIKKDFPGIKQGLCLVRKGSTNAVANRADFDSFYSEKSGGFVPKILRNCLRAIDGTALLDVSLRNLSPDPVTIISGILLIKDAKNTIKSTHHVYGFEKEVGADFRFEIPAKREFTGDLYLGFESSDCLRLNLDDSGYTDEQFIFVLQLKDSIGKEYEVISPNSTVYAKGECLWKIKTQNQPKNHRINNSMLGVFIQRFQAKE